MLQSHSGCLATLLTACGTPQVADLKGCPSVLFFEARKKQDCYLWVSRTPAGPCAKFHVANGARVAVWHDINTCAL